MSKPQLKCNKCRQRQASAQFYNAEHADKKKRTANCLCKPENEYKKLKAEWYKKLEDSGFKDIEQDEDNLKVWSSKLSRKHTVEQWQAKEAYYNMATSFLNDYQFETELDRIIWEYHSNAISIRNIVDLLKAANISKPYRDGVFTTIKRLKETMRQLYALKSIDEYDS